jgi:hypothetical protein
MDDPILRIRQQNEEKARLELEQARHDQEIASLASIDISKVEKKLDVSNRILKDIYEKPVGGGGSGSSWPAVNSEGLAQPLTIDDNGALQITGSITASASTLADYSVNDMTDTYFGFTKPDGTWLVKQVTDTSVTYATVSNNGTVTSYTDAWTAKATLTYGRFDEAF